MDKLKTIIISHYYDELNEEQRFLQREIVRHQVRAFSRSNYVSDILVINSNGLSNMKLDNCDVLETDNSFYEKILAIYTLFRHDRVGIAFADLPYISRLDIDRYLDKTIDMEEDLVFQLVDDDNLPSEKMSTGYFNIVNMDALPDYTNELLSFLKLTENDDLKTIINGLEIGFPNVYTPFRTLMKSFYSGKLYDCVFETELNNLGIEAVIGVADTINFSKASYNAKSLENAYDDHVKISNRLGDDIIGF